MLKSSPPPRPRISSTVRAPDMPLPMTTRLRFAPIGSNLHEAEVYHDFPGETFGRRYHQFDHGVGQDVVANRVRHVNPTLRPAGEQPHRFAVVMQCQVEKFPGRIADSAVDQMGALVRWNLVRRLRLEANRGLQST